MDFAEQLRILQAAQGDPALLALATVEFAHDTLSERERRLLKKALLAAAVPHWCDAPFLAALLQVPEEDSELLLSRLRSLNVIEPFPARGLRAVNVHGAGRIALREHLRTTNKSSWTDLAIRAREYVKNHDSGHATIEALYHLFAIDQNAAAIECEKWDQQLTTVVRPGLRQAMGAAMSELVKEGWLDGVAATEARLFVLGLRGYAGEVAQVNEPAQEVLAREWAVRAIYAVLDRQGPCQALTDMGGVFTLPTLSSLAWGGEGFKLSNSEQETLLEMMERCALCFPIDQSPDKRMVRYAAPGLLPLESDVTIRMEAIWRPDLPNQRVSLLYESLHEGVLRQLLCEIGTIGGADAVYWKYGCCFYDGATHSRARISSENIGTTEAPARGRIDIETCDGDASELLARLQAALSGISNGLRQAKNEHHGSKLARSFLEARPLAETLRIAPAPTEKPLIYLSYAWGGAKEELVVRLEERLIREGYEVKRDKRAMRPGDWISDFMRDIGRAERVCVVLSEKYIQSTYCMRELLYLYQSSLGEKQGFLNRIVPIVLEDAKISKPNDRLACVRYWNSELQGLREATSGLDPATWGGVAADMAMIQDFCHHTELMLRHVSDCLMPRGISNIEKDDFGAVLAALTAKV